MMEPPPTSSGHFVSTRPARHPQGGAVPKPNEYFRGRNRLESKLDEYNHTMELVRTIVPLIVLALQVAILVRIS